MTSLGRVELLAQARVLEQFGPIAGHPRVDAITNPYIAIMQIKVPAPQNIEPDAPLRLSAAAALAFPDGSMTASGLHRASD